MNAHYFFIVIVFFVVFDFVFDKILDYVNAKSWDRKKPKIVENLYNPNEYEKARNYAKVNGKLALFSGFLSFISILAMLFFDGFAILDNWVREISNNQIIQTLLFFGSLSLASSLISLPFSIYKTFVIEEKYGFNKTSPKTFITDLFKGLILSALLGIILLGSLTWVFYKMGDNFWWIAWIIVTGFSLFFATFYTSLIVPIFNKLSPLSEGSLRSSIEEYATKVDFPLKNIFVIDGSKRSNKANAFFSGLGSKKAIVLYDTLIEDNTDEELTAVLAHEVGHYKLKHIKSSLILGVIQTGILFILFGWLSKNPQLSNALGVTENSFHISLIAFSLLYAPISLLTGVFMNTISRKNEFEADAFAKETYIAQPLESALKKLAKKHLSNLTPHPWYVFFHYSHPPLAQRLQALSSIDEK